MTEKQKDLRTYKLVMIGITFLLYLIGAMFGMVNYNYQVDKCDKMDLQTSDYDFNHRIEIDAKFNQKCFYYKNHPLAFAGEIFGGGFAIGFISLLGWTVWGIRLSSKYY